LKTLYCCLFEHIGTIDTLDQYVYQMVIIPTNLVTFVSVLDGGALLVSTNGYYFQMSTFKETLSNVLTDLPCTIFANMISDVL